eukprot:6402722-Prymnesium_polylepis.3
MPTSAACMWPRRKRRRTQVSVVDTVSSPSSQRVYRSSGALCAHALEELAAACSTRALTQVPG